MCWVVNTLADVWIQMKYPVPLSMSRFYIIVFHNQSHSAIRPRAYSSGSSSK